MQHRYRLVMLVSAIATLASCAPIRPSPFLIPSTTDTPNTYIGALGLPQKKIMLEIIDQTRIYEGAWASASDTLDKWKFDTDEATFYGAVTAALSGIARSPEGAVAGAAVATAASLFKNHYALAVQSNNYRRASDAMGCLYNVAQEVPEEFWKYAFDSTTGITTLPAETPNRDTVVGIPSKMNLAIRSIISRLRTAQYAVELVTPKIPDLTKAFQAAAQQRGVSAPENAVAANMAKNEDTKTLVMRAPAGGAMAFSLDTWDKVYKLPGEFDKCVATFGG